VRYHLGPLTRPEMERYIEHRLHVAGGFSGTNNGAPDFNRWALGAIYRYSRGIPRLVNAVCDKTLLCGYVTGDDLLTRGHVRRAIRELEGDL
jgi:general secretion pathway protein A